MNKKAITVTTNELIALVLLIPAIIFIYYSYQYVADLFAPAELDQQTIDNFRRLGREIKDLVKDVELKEKGASAEITVPLYMQKGTNLVPFNYENIPKMFSESLPKKCHTENCLCIYPTIKLEKPTECIEFRDIYFESHVSIGQTITGSMDIRLELTKNKISGLGDFALKIEKAKV